MCELCVLDKLGVLDSPEEPEEKIEGPTPYVVVPNTSNIDLLDEEAAAWEEYYRRGFGGYGGC